MRSQTSQFAWAIAVGACALLTVAGGIALAADPQPPPKPTPPPLIRGVMNGDLKVLQAVGANSCLLWGPPGKPAEWDKLIQAGQFVFVNGLGSEPKEFFEFEGKKRARMRVPFCYAGEWGHWWADHVAKAAAQHYPAIHNLTPDECAWTNGHVPYLFGIRQPVGTVFYCDCEQCLKAMGERKPALTASRFLEVKEPADAEAVRRFVNYRYQTVADTLKAGVERARQDDPGFLSYCTLNLREVFALERYPYGVALDLLPQFDILVATSFQTGPDRRGESTRFLAPMVVKYLLAARPRLGAVPALAATVYDYRQKFDWTEAYYWRKEIEDLLPKPVLDSMQKDLEPYAQRDDDVILPALSCIAHGARGVMFFGEDRKEALKTLFTLMDKLEPDLAGATVPGEIVVLCSRQSEDEWMVQHAPKAGSRADLSDAMMQAGCWAQTANRIAWEYNQSAPHSQGFRSTHAVMQTLMRAGLPFRLHFVENLEATDLAEARAVIVPFCTHLPDAKAALLQAAAAKAKLIVFAHRGEFDQTGRPRATAALADPKIVFFDAEASQSLQDRAGRAKLVEALGNVSDVRVACDTEAVEHDWLRLPDGGIAVFIINREEQPAIAQLALPGTAKARLFSQNGQTTEVDRAARVEVPAREARVIIQAGAR